MSDARMVSEPMTWSEICERFPDQWLALVEIDWVDERDEPVRLGFVAGAGTRRGALEQAKPLLRVFDKLGHYFTGHAPPALPRIVYVS